ncbi:MAG: Asp-tRNA(Asn)/Glu-tRNA(Gln) amidotransferase subunit GatA [Candidatus Marinimicrobia bacterium]|nr:Asp-tRNA(Asn)/Glu-tRNA(Gln) amidotransferase subunit GatA [Candidatus Neomarinimicrobiota bacterium]
MTISDFLERVQNAKPLNAFISIDQTHIREQYEKQAEGSLARVFIGIKDNISVQGQTLSCASHILENFISPYDATVVKKLKNAGAIIAGKTNMDEFAMGSSSEYSHYSAVRNAVHPEYVAGGSSGGSAVAVAAGVVDAALGSDTGGSVRQPASYNGIVGMKPTYGRVSRYGLVAFASSLDQIGIMSTSVENSAKILEVIAGEDPLDATTVPEPVPTFSKNMESQVSDWKIGLPKEYFTEGLSESVRQAVNTKVEALKAAGATIVPISLPHTEYAISIYYIITSAEASSNLARYDGVRYGLRHEPSDLMDMYTQTRANGFGSEVKRRIMLGTYVLSSGYYDAYYDKAQRVRRLLQSDFTQAFQSVDAIITPTTPTTAFKRGEKIDDPLAMYLNDIYTVSVNLAGLPAVSLPVGTDDKGLPIGLQIIAPAFKEETIFKIGTLIERLKS